jgi:uncharacterized membrane protein
MGRVAESIVENWLTASFLVLACVLALSMLVGRNRWPVSAWRRGGIVLMLLLLTAAGAVLPGITVTAFGQNISLAGLLVAVAVTGFVVAFFLLLYAHRWSFSAAVTLALLGICGLAGIIVPAATTLGHEAVRAVRGLEFVQPVWLLGWLWLPWIVWISRRSLSGLGPRRKALAITVRLLLVAVLAAALAEPRFRRATDAVTVLFVVDRSQSIPEDPEPDQPVALARDRRWERVRQVIEEAVSGRGVAHRDDAAGLILFGKRPKLVLPPAMVDRLPVDLDLAGPIDGTATDIAAALKLAMASFPEGRGKRIVLISDGNETIGRAEEQANLARQNSVEIDTIALAAGYRHENEVLVQAVEAPPTATRGARLPVRVLIRNAHPGRVVDGRLEVLKIGGGPAVAVPGQTVRQQLLEIEDSPQVLDNSRNPATVRLYPGLNVFRFLDRAEAEEETSFSYRATLTPLASAPLEGGRVVAGLPGDRPANNRATTAVVARGQRRVLFLDDVPALKGSRHRYLVETLIGAQIRLDWLPVEKLPAEKNDLAVFLSNYDSVLIGNVPAERFTADQQESIRAAVSDQGCGLVMIGGPDSYGPGGYQQTPIEAALPVDCEIKALKAAGKGGLVLIMHASEMADGNQWQKQIAKLAIQRLGPLDLVGLTQYGLGPQGVQWLIPFQPVGESGSTNRARILAAIDRMIPGDMPDLNPFLQEAADTLADPKYELSVKHCILISDGDPNYSAPGRAAVRQMAANNITCTTVGVATHGGAEKTRLKEIAEATQDAQGKPGNFYDVTNPSQLPAIYIKESRRVSQSFIYDKAFTPILRLRGGPTEGLPEALPPLFGFVRTTRKESPLVEMAIEGPPVMEQRFPILATWRYGLGKSAAFTSDARSIPGSEERFWDRDWVASELYRKFWEQLVNWSLREAERGRLQLVTEYRDGRVRIVADVRDEQDRPVGGLTLSGRVSTPSAAAESPPPIVFRSKGGGLYEAEFPAEEAGSYFVTVQAIRPKLGGDGKIVRDAAGQPLTEVYDSARAGVTVPYSPEFADLESNTPLLRRLAELTGGQFYTEDDPRLDEAVRTAAFFRPAPDATRALLPFWYWLVFAAGILLLVDVAIRRISLELAEVRSTCGKAWAWLRGWNEPEPEAGSGLDRLSRRKAAVARELQRQQAARRFEPAGSSLAEPPPAGAEEYRLPPPAVAPPSSGSPPAAESAQGGPPAEADDPLTRLRKARDRARHRREQERD